MRSILAALLALSVFLPTPTSVAVLPIRVFTASAVNEGTAVIVARDDRATGVLLHLVTSARLFPDGWHTVRVGTMDDTFVDVNRSDIVVSGSRLVEVAIVRLLGTRAPATPAPLVWRAPAPDAPIQIHGLDARGASIVIDGRVRFLSTRLIVADRDASGLHGCLGAPATDEDGVFGIVSECGQGRTATIATLSMDRWFIERYVPHLPSVTRTER